ncbi:RNA polymerase sigma factor [Chitinophaga arvensicola]|uniref:RNA polymerase sigma-70 factor, ECF subfamily n=1 Tax=Chitinophaga arvensicola TaxID=29529 RepID=A0A1I0S925_9BACT|nr:sigma-70 family RNA polymerase sigma factor [Chitinophaga arvensicola]SEW52627.1 RNA polymerase sigma-70 factor, ECF subfamily [Chitinophaga arvensicola]
MEDFTQLITECALNNRLSQEKLYYKLYPALFLLCRKFFPDNNDALEALNDGMLLVFKNIGKFNADKGAFFNWAYTIVRNAALDKLRLQKWPEHRELDNYLPETKEALWGKLDWKDIYKLLDYLPPATRSVCTLFYLEDFSIKDISEQLQLSQGTVKWHLSETRARLKPVFKAHYQHK